jgi:dihydrofolate reductase
MMRKIIAYIATSADGYIARQDGSVDWLQRPRSAGDYGMGVLLKRIDTIVWGRKMWQSYSRALRPAVKNYVFTSRPPKTRVSGVEFVNEPVAAFSHRLRAASSKNVWIMGGSGIIASFLDAGVIDEFIIHIVPTFIGAGIPLIAPRQRTVSLELLSCRRYADGVVRLHYAVLPRASSKKASRNATGQKRAKARKSLHRSPAAPLRGSP